MNAELPYSPEAEESVLGSLLMSPEILPDIAPELRPQHFHIQRHGWIYAAILGLYEHRRAIDFRVVADELRRAGQLEAVGGESYLARLLAETPSPYRATEYAGIVRQYARRRAMIEAAGSLTRAAYDLKADPDTTLERAESALFAVAHEGQTHRPQPMGEVMGRYYEHLAYLRDHPDAPRGLPTGFYDLDALLRGLRRAEMTIVAARPGMGKTSLLVDIARHAARGGAHVAAFSLEMSETSLAHRLVSAETEIDGARLDGARLSDDEWRQIAGAVGRLGDLPIYLDDSAELTPLQLRSKCRQMYAEHGLDLVIVDYLQLMHSDGRSENRLQEVSAISRGLKALAKELDVPVVAAAQLNRASEARGDNRPKLSDLRESGQIEQDSDVVILLYRDEVYNRDTQQKNVAEVIVAKHRQGPVGKCLLRYDAEYTRFQNAVVREIQL